MKKTCIFTFSLSLALFCLPLCSGLAADTPTDWPKLVQAPYAGLSTDSAKLTELPDSADAWKAQRGKLMAAWLKHLGPMPEPAPLDPIVESEETVEGIRRILLSFATEGPDRCRAYLLLPKGYKVGEKRPAAVVFHQTTFETLLEPVGLGWMRYAMALDLTRRGYVTLSPECYIMKDQGPAEEYAKTWGPYTQYQKLIHRRPDWTGMGKMTFDASRCVDYLETRPEVDTKRIAACGFSLGAKEVLYALAFEPRFAVGVFMEGGIGLNMSNWLDPWYLTDFPRDKVGEREHHEVLALIAPKPFLIIGADDGTGKNTNAADGAPSWPFVKAALPVYQALGAGDRLGLHCNGLNEHNMDEYSKEMAYNWIDEWLNVDHPGNRYTPTLAVTETDPCNTPGTTQPLRVLFVGNSQMAQYNLPEMIAGLADSAPVDAPRIIVGRSIVGGMSLKKHWEVGEGPGTARAMIASPDSWDYVVIQEIYTHWGNKLNPQEFEEYATRFDEAITRTGAQTIVFATASVTELTLPEYRYPDAFKALNDMQIAFAEKRGLRVAAGGYSWIKYLGSKTSLEERLDLYDKDKGHPGTKGSYLYACLLYSAITGRNPEGLTHEFKNIRGGVSIPKDEALNMQKVAWEQYQENKTR